MRDSSERKRKEKRKIEKPFITPDFSLKGSRCIYFLRIRKGMTLVIVFLFFYGGGGGGRGSGGGGGGGRERGKIADVMNIETASAIFYCRFAYYYNWSTSSIFKE